MAHTIEDSGKQSPIPILLEAKVSWDGGALGEP